MKSGMADAEKMLDIVLAFYNKKDYYDLLNFILTKMMEITNADGGTLYVIEDGMLHFRIMRTISLNIFLGATEKIDLPPIRLDKNNIRNISAYAALKNEIISIDDVYNSAKFNFEGPKNYDKITGYRTCSMLVFPLSTQNGELEEVIGIIQLINAIDKETGCIKPFADGEYDLLFLRALSNFSANALSNLKQAKEIKELFNSFVKVMTKAIDERSPYNINHTNNVARYCDDFARYLRQRFPAGHAYHFDKDRSEKLVMAAFLHDIGKIITPLEIMDKPDRLYHRMEIVRYKFQIKKYQLEIDYLKKIINEEQYKDEQEYLDNALSLVEKANKASFLSDDEVYIIKDLANIAYVDENGDTVPVLTAYEMNALTIRKGTLTDEERRTMNEHVLVTEKLLAEMSFDKYHREVPVWAKDHHEFLDGSGYPLGLSGSQVTVETCILSLTDIYDALTANDRPYKKAVSSRKALSILWAMADEGKLHKELVQLFVDSGVWTLPSE